VACWIVGNSEELRNAEKSTFQAEYEGSIPFTRSNLFKRLENRDCERGREIRNESWLLFGRRRPSLARGVGLAGPFQLDRVIGLE